MFKSIYIRIVSGLMLMIFALSITPKKYLHNVFAKHSDNKLVKKNGQSHQVTNSGYNCDNDNLVAESSFVGTHNYFDLPLQPFFSSYIFKDISFSFLREVYSSLRGPPVSI